MRAFIAIELPDEVVDSILDASKELASKGTTLVKKEAMHITTHFFADITEDGVRQVSEAMKNAPLQAFEAEALGVSRFSYRVVFVEISEGRHAMESLQRTLSERIFVEFDTRNEFTPHITIARAKPTQDTRRIVSFIKKYEGHSFGRFMVNKISLKQSTLGAAGPEYKTLFERKF